MQHIVSLVETMLPVYTNAVNEQIGEVESEPRYHRIESFPSDMPVERQIELSKNLLLYFPLTTVSDPLANFLWPRTMDGSGISGLLVGDEAEFRKKLRDALAFIAGIDPLLSDGSSVLVPETFITMDPVIQNAARIELDGRDDAEALKEDTSEQMQVEAITLGGHLCKLFDLVPMTSTNIGREALHNEYIRVAQGKRPKVEMRIANALFEHSLPGLDEVESSEIAKLRSREPAFQEWRVSFQDVLERANSEDFADDNEFELQFKRASEDRRSLAFPVTPPCVRVRTRRFGRITRQLCSARKEVPGDRSKRRAWRKKGLLCG